MHETVNRLKWNTMDKYCVCYHLSVMCSGPFKSRCLALALLFCLAYIILLNLAARRAFVGERIPSNGTIVSSHRYDDQNHVMTEPDVSMITEKTLLVFVQSASTHVEKRAIIRNTWGRRTHYARFANETNLVVVFALGKDYIGKRESWDRIEEEMARYNDLLILDIRDEYNMLSLKGLYTMKWIERRLPQVRYVMKTDDDVLLNIPIWFEVIRGLERSGSSCCVVCYVWIHPVILRWHAKYSVSVQEYPYGNYPSFCSGLGYLMTKPALTAILRASEHLLLFVRDDPYFTGMLGYVANVRLITVPRRSVIINGDPEEVAGALQEPVLAVHDAPLSIWTVLWEQMLMDYESGIRQRNMPLRVLMEHERILPYIRPAFDVKRNLLLSETCSQSEPKPGTIINIDV